MKPNLDITFLSKSKVHQHIRDLKVKQNIRNSHKMRPYIWCFGNCTEHPNNLKAPNASFMINVVIFILVFIWLTERKIKQSVHLENSTKSIFIYRHQKKIIISQNCVSHHLKASYFINKNQAAGLHLPHMCLTNRCMGLSMQHKSKAQHLQGRWWLCLVSRAWHSTFDRLIEYFCQNFVRKKWLI